MAKYIDYTSSGKARRDYNQSTPRIKSDFTPLALRKLLISLGRVVDTDDALDARDALAVFLPELQVDASE